jgi:hypothetical protein
MAQLIAECKCSNQSFIIGEKSIICTMCGKEYPFEFVCEGVCSTNADDLVILINEGY